MSSHIHFRSKYAGKLRTSVFQDFHKTDPAELRVSTFNTSTCITLPPSMWQQITNGKRKKTPLVCMTNLDFPKELKQKYLEQLDKVYTKCIFPGQFLPQLFNKSNASIILKTRLHISEKQWKKEDYTNPYIHSIPQHCRHYGKESIYKHHINKKTTLFFLAKKNWC